MVLLHLDGSTISREGAPLLRMAHACQNALDEGAREGEAEGDEAEEQVEEDGGGGGDAEDAEDAEAVALQGAEILSEDAGKGPDNDGPRPTLRLV